MRIVAASWVITGHPGAAPVERGALALDDDDRVLAVATLDALRARWPAAKIESHAAVLMPGLVNAHTHLELSALRARVPGGGGFGPWVAQMVQARDELDDAARAEAIELAVSELLAAGTVAVGEVTNTLAAVPVLAGLPVLARVFHEVYGLRKDAADTMLGMAEQARAELGALPANVSYALAPHTTFTLHPDAVSTILARVRAVPSVLTSLHLAEHGAERAFLRDGSGPFADFMSARGSTRSDWAMPGLDPVRYAQRLGALAHDVLAVHLCDARPDELALVAQAGMPVVLCPRSNLHIELKLPPLLAMLEIGMRPALGTDSLASCASLDVLEEARALHERFPSVAPRTLLAMATRFGAEALGLSAQLGTLDAGKRPGVIAFEHDGGATPADPERFVLSRRARSRKVLARPSSSLLEAS
jgi:cytosine/adenosine deaminase-related metal-dependent hydrolase